MVAEIQQNICYMQKFLTTKSIFLDKQTLWLFVCFVGIRIISFALAGHDLIQAMILFALMMVFAMLYFKKMEYAFYILLGELLLGGAGHFLEFYGLSMRTILVFTFIFLWVAHHISTRELQNRLYIDRKIFYIFFSIVGIAIITALLGLSYGNNATNVIRDLIPFSYFLLLLPFYHLFQEEKTQEYIIRLLTVFLLGGVFFSLFVYFLYSSELGVLHDSFYQWFRDVSMGKITDMGLGFFRIVAPEHLLAVPGILFISSLLMRDEKHHKAWRVLLTLGLLILVLNLSRTYFLAMVIGFLVLKYKHSWKRWFRITIGTFAVYFLLLISVSLISSFGTSSGLGMFGFRFLSMATPQIETSTYTRTALLEPIFMMIKKHPVLGNGLGSEINFFSPLTYEQIKTTQFEWGYLEMATELGILGLSIFLIVICFILYELNKKIQSLSDYHDFYVGLLAGLIALLVMNFTSPILYHVLGVFCLVTIISVVVKPISIFEKVLPLLYRIFNKKHN